MRTHADRFERIKRNVEIGFTNAHPKFDCFDRARFGAVCNHDDFEKIAVNVLSCERIESGNRISLMKRNDDTHANASCLFVTPNEARVAYASFEKTTLTLQKAS